MASPNMLIASGTRSGMSTSTNEADIDISEYTHVSLLLRPTVVGSTLTVSLQAKDETSGGGLYWQLVGYGAAVVANTAYGLGLNAGPQGGTTQMQSFWAAAIPMKILRINWAPTGSYTLSWELWGVRAG
jgi:hypothetical protein